MSDPTDNKDETDPPLRPHVYDGIQEFDNKLPNWWLLTLYGAIVFSFIYWLVFTDSNLLETGENRMAAEMQRIEAAKLTASADMLNDDRLWDMSRNGVLVAAGAEIYKASCLSCHGMNLEGGIGVNLRDTAWVHGGAPVDVYRTVHDGVLLKGMPAWGPQMGARKVAEVVAFVLSHHKPGDEVVIVPSPIPGAPPQP